MMSAAPSSPSLRVATFNVGLGFVRKLPDILTQCSALSLDIVALQEIGDPALLHPSLHHYSLSLAPGASRHEGGVGILLSRTLTPFCRSYFFFFFEVVLASVSFSELANRRTRS